MSRRVRRRECSTPPTGLRSSVIAARRKLTREAVGGNLQNCGPVESCSRRYRSRDCRRGAKRERASSADRRIAAREPRARCCRGAAGGSESVARGVATRSRALVGSDTDDLSSDLERRRDAGAGAPAPAYGFPTVATEGRGVADGRIRGEDSARKFGIRAPGGELRTASRSRGNEGGASAEERGVRIAAYRETRSHEPLHP